jgi:hypothetical protein
VNAAGTSEPGPEGKKMRVDERKRRVGKRSRREGEERQTHYTDAA